MPREFESEFRLTTSATERVAEIRKQITEIEKEFGNASDSAPLDAMIASGHAATARTLDNLRNTYSNSP